jgi:hypothetical protein
VFELSILSDCSKWHAAKIEELKNHIGPDIKNQQRKETFRKLIDDDQYDKQVDKIYRLVWKYVIKKDGNNMKYKARLAIDGSIEHAGIDLDTADSTGNVVSAEARRVLYSFAAHHKLQYRVYDIKAAFLTADLEDHRRVFIKAPYGTNTICPDILDSEIVRVQNHFYGLKSSAKGFEKRLVGVLQGQQMQDEGVVFKEFKSMKSTYIYTLTMD